MLGGVGSGAFVVGVAGLLRAAGSGGLLPLCFVLRLQKLSLFR